MASVSGVSDRVRWTVVVPLLALMLLIATWGRDLPGVVLVLVGLFLVGAVLSAVQHAEVVAHQVGEPFGSLLLAVAVTVIEVGLIVTLTISGGDETAGLARDTVFAAVMISVNGIAGLSFVVSALKHRVSMFNPEGAGAAMATVITLATICLVLPTFTTTTPGPEFTAGQLAFAAIASLAIYVLFVFTQTVRHRDFFLPVDSEGVNLDADGDGHADPPGRAAAWRSGVLLVVALVGVVGLAKISSKPIEDGVQAVGFPQAFVGVVIALLVLLPESIAAVRQAAAGRTQVSLNLAYGSAMASIGLTIPTIAVASIWLDGPLLLGLDATQMVLLAASVVVGILTVVPGRSKVLLGGLHLVLMAAFVFLAISP